MLTSFVRRLPPVARRDATIKDLRRQLRRAQASTGDGSPAPQTAEPVVEALQPSFLYKLREADRLNGLLKREGRSVPVWQLNGKPDGYRFAVSHGIPVPPIIGAFRRPADVPWDDLPDEFVVKTFAGTASNGVMPLRRDGNNLRDLLSRRHLTSQEVCDRLSRLSAAGSASEELFIEELMHAPTGTGLEVVPDYKIYCFHGTIGMIMVAGRRNRSRTGRAFRYFGPDGGDLGNARPGLPTNPELPAPRHLEALVDSGRRLSRAIKVPFVRVDLYERDEGVVFGEITPAPGGVQVLTPELDLAFGELWEDAQSRLEHEAIGASLRQTEYGPTPHDHLWRV